VTFQPTAASSLISKFQGASIFADEWIRTPLPILPSKDRWKFRQEFRDGPGPTKRTQLFGLFCAVRPP
jgi:hypothetical protein